MTIRVKEYDVIRITEYIMLMVFSSVFENEKIEYEKKDDEDYDNAKGDERD
jgi:hypothetical protein